MAKEFSLIGLAKDTNEQSPRKDTVTWQHPHVSNTKEILLHTYQPGASDDQGTISTSLKEGFIHS